MRIMWGLRDVRLLLRAGSLVAVAALSVVAAEGRARPGFDPSPTEACVAASTAASRDRASHAVLDCVGKAARVCFTSPGGDTTIGMIECLGAENAFWEARLTAAYAARMEESLRADDEMARHGSSSASLAEALREMQRAWIAYRDATCLHEQAQWRGGTGGGPATMACHMHETARQALRLEGWWAE